MPLDPITRQRLNEFNRKKFRSRPTGTLTDWLIALDWLEDQNYSREEDEQVFQSFFARDFQPSHQSIRLCYLASISPEIRDALRERLSHRVIYLFHWHGQYEKETIFTLQTIQRMLHFLQLPAFQLLRTMDDVEFSSLHRRKNVTLCTG